MLLAGISLLSYRRRTALLWKVEGSSLFLCFFLQTIIKTVDSNVQLYFHIFIYCHFFIGEINLEISKRFKRLLYAILHHPGLPGTLDITISGMPCSRTPVCFHSLAVTTNPCWWPKEVADHPTQSIVLTELNHFTLSHYGVPVPCPTLKHHC